MLENVRNVHDHLFPNHCHQSEYVKCMNYYKPLWIISNFFLSFWKLLLLYVFIIVENNANECVRLFSLLSWILLYTVLRYEKLHRHTENHRHWFWMKKVTSCVDELRCCFIYLITINFMNFLCAKKKYNQKRTDLFRIRD